MTSSRRRRRTRRRRFRIALWFTGVAVAVVGALVASVLTFAAGLASTYEQNVETLAAVDAFPAEADRPVPQLDGVQNILLIASDSRGEAAKVGQTDAASQRSDVLMLVHVDADREHVSVVSIMRDSWVDIPGRGPAKVNAALSWGGTPLAVATVEQLLGVRVDHVALIGFAGFERMTDALGGVTVTVDEAFETGGREYQAGENYLDGKRALDFVRERYAFVDGDYQRVRNQQAFLGALARKMISSGTFTSPGKISALVSAVSSNLATDEAFTLQTAFELGVSLKSLRAEDIQFITLPSTGTGTEGDQSVVRVDTAALDVLRARLAADTLSDPVPIAP